jgi:hypothetical protein
MHSSSSFCRSQRWSAALSFVLAATLAACGGGGGDSSGGGAAGPLTITGTAANGAAIGGGTVDAKCGAGSGSGSTQADGTYSLTIAGGAWPCVVRVTVAGGPVLYSLTPGAGSAAVANITPFTQLIFASLLAAEPAGAYDSFSSSVAAAITSAALAASQAQVVQLLKAAGIDITSLGDLISATLTPRTATAPGDAYDQALDNLASSLSRSGTTLATLTTAAVGAASGPSTAPVASLPAELLLQPATPTCSAMRSGTYRLVTPTSGATIAEQTSLAVFDATTLRITRADGSTSTWSANGECRFTDQGSGYSADLVVSQAGVMVGRYTKDNGATYRNFIGFVEQSHTLAELAGDWNNINLGPQGAGFVGSAGSATLNASGVFTAGTACENASTWAIDVCTPLTASLLDLLSPLVVDNSGGFDFIDKVPQAVTARAFAYRSGSGRLMMVAVGREGGFGFWAPQSSVALPTVGAVTTSWNIDTNASLGSASAIYLRSNTIASVDAATGSYSRIQKTPGTNNDHPETLFINNPRAGFLFRPAGSSTAVDGSLQTINQFSALRLPGSGIAPALLQRLQLFNLSVIAP